MNARHNHPNYWRIPRTGGRPWRLITISIFIILATAIIMTTLAIFKLTRPAVQPSQNTAPAYCSQFAAECRADHLGSNVVMVMQAIEPVNLSSASMPTMFPAYCSQFVAECQAEHLAGNLANADKAGRTTVPSYCRQFAAECSADRLRIVATP